MKATTTKRAPLAVKKFIFTLYDYDAKKEAGTIFGYGKTSTTATQDACRRSGFDFKKQSADIRFHGWPVIEADDRVAGE